MRGAGVHPEVRADLGAFHRDMKRIFTAKAVDFSRKRERKIPAVHEKTAGICHAAGNLRLHFFFTRCVRADFSASSAWISAMRVPVEFLYTSAVRGSLQEGWVALMQLSFP